MATILQIIGAFSIGSALTYGVWKGWNKVKNIKLQNPIKKYIRKIVLDYLHELQK